MIVIHDSFLHLCPANHTDNLVLASYRYSQSGCRHASDCISETLRHIGFLQCNLETGKCTTRQSARCSRDSCHSFSIHLRNGRGHASSYLLSAKIANTG